MKRFFQTAFMALAIATTVAFGAATVNAQSMGGHVPNCEITKTDVLEAAKSNETEARKVEGAEFKALGAILKEMVGATWEDATEYVYLIPLKGQNVTIVIEMKGDCVLFFAPIPTDNLQVMLDRTIAEIEKMRGM